MAFAGSEPVAFGFLTRNASPIDGHWASVTRLQRSLAWRGSGAGTQVLTALEEHARSLGLEFLQLAVRGGTGRERYYAAQGWRLVAVLPRWLRIGSERRDALIMVKPLSVEASVDVVPSLPVPVVRLDPALPLPRYAHPGDAGLDLHARQDVTLGPGERALMPTGVAVAIPDGHVGLVHPRSGLALRHGVSLVNTPGTIDAGYRGELQVPLINHDRSAAVTIRRGDRIAQLLVQPVAHAALVEVDELPEAARSAGGFGSTGL